MSKISTVSKGSARACSQPTTNSLPSQMMALRRFGNNIGIFWRIICYAGVLLALLSILVTNPSFYAGPRGWAAIVLAVCYLAAFTYGSRWMAGNNPDSYWKLRLSAGRVLQPWRAVALWATLVALSVVMFALNGNFAWLVWVPFGMSLSLLPMPRCLLLVIPTILLAMGFYGGLPDNFSLPELLKFATFAMGLAVYCAVIYLPLALLRGRFQREWTFQQLEQSHRDLEEAHQQLEEAAAHERELAVLRERGRLARDMHDTLGHSLALIAVKLEAAQRLRSVDPDRADHEVVATQAIARDALAELRAAIADLRVPGSAHATLCDALRGVAEESATRAGWRLTCEVAPDVEPMDDQTRAALLRTSHEALANIERHAHAHAVHVSLTRQSNTVVLRIEDDGVGILTTNPPTRRVGALVPRGGSPESAPGAPADVHENEGNDTIASPQGHYGITGMRERTMGAGGAFMIGAGADSHGTCVEVRLPAIAESGADDEGRRR